MKTTVELAREAGFETKRDMVFVDATEITPTLKAFEALVRADQDEKYKWDIHSCGPTCKRSACVAMREAVEAEREECAKVCDRIVEGKDPDDIHSDSQWTALSLAAAIRARGVASTRGNT
jgi:hypothetical protein